MSLKLTPPIFALSPVDVRWHHCTHLDSETSRVGTTCGEKFEAKTIVIFGPTHRGKPVGDILPGFLPCCRQCFGPELHKAVVG